MSESPIVKSLLHARLVNVNVGLYQFSPGIFTTIITIALLYVMLSFGQWQWDKGEYREQLQATITSRMDIEPVELHLLPESVMDRRFLPVTATGRFDSEHQFLYDNRIVKGRSGYDVYTPFLTDAGHLILVNRGWLPQGRTRQDLPEVSVTDEPVTITGLLDTYPSKGVILADDVNQGTSWPRVLQYLDEDELSAMSGRELYEMVIWLKPDTEYGYVREYPALNLNSEKNTGYAFQWYAMSLALSIIYLLVNTKKRDQSTT